MGGLIEVEGKSFLQKEFIKFVKEGLVSLSPDNIQSLCG